MQQTGGAAHRASPLRSVYDARVLLQCGALASTHQEQGQSPIEARKHHHYRMPLLRVAPPMGRDGSACGLVGPNGSNVTCAFTNAQMLPVRGRWARRGGKGVMRILMRV